MMEEDDLDLTAHLDNDFTASQMHMQEGGTNAPAFPSHNAPKSIIDGVTEYHRGKTTKYFNDPVQGHLRIDPSCVEIIDTPQFQRLRDLKQLGCTYYVFPGACHNRFEHSLGVSYLAEDVATRIYRTQRLDLDMDIQDIRLVRLAGLIHDIGHGPFSHVFENEFLPSVGVKDFHHEGMTEMLLEHLVDDNSIDLSPSDLSTIKALVRSDVKDNLKQKKFLKEIVANSRNSVDVDKFDYMERDCYHCGIKASCDFSRLRSFLKVIDDEICYRASEVSNVYDLFATRASLHRKVYTHRKAKSVEYMIVDALKEANPILKISEKVNDATEYWKLDDTVVKQIEISSDPRLQKSRDILKRLRRRELYRYVNEFTVPGDRLQSWEPLKPEYITTCQTDSSVNLVPDDVIVHNLKIDFAMKDKNPVDHVSFFRDFDSTNSFKIPKEKVSTLLPSSFLERKVRVYSRNRDPEYITAIAAAFEEYQRRNGINTQVHSTPTKSKNAKKRQIEHSRSASKRTLTFHSDTTIPSS